MESVKVKTGQTEKSENSGKVIRVSEKHRQIIENGRKEINKDQTYKRKISCSRYLEKLIEDYWQKPIPELQKEREGSKDWLELRYKLENPNIPFFDWVRLQVESGGKKSLKRSSGGEK